MPRRDGTGPPDGSGRGRGLGDCGKSRDSQSPGTQVTSSSNTLLDIAAQVLLSIIRAITAKKPDQKQE